MIMFECSQARETTVTIIFVPAAEHEEKGRKEERRRKWRYSAFESFRLGEGRGIRGN
jgi:hypothetical protein